MQPLTTYHKLLLMLMFLPFNYGAKAQHVDSATYHPNELYYWGGFHIGGGIYLIDIGFNAGMLINNRFIVGYENGIYGNIPLDKTSGQNLDAYEHSLIVGVKLTNQRLSNISVYSGISLIRLETRGNFISSSMFLFAPDNYTPDTFYDGIGVPVGIKYTITPTPMFGFDFSAGANINLQRSFLSLNFAMIFGKIRSGNAELPPGSPHNPPDIPRPPFPFGHQKNLDNKN